MLVQPVRSQAPLFLLQLLTYKAIADSSHSLLTNAARSDEINTKWRLASVSGEGRYVQKDRMRVRNEGLRLLEISATFFGCKKNRRDLSILIGTH